MLGVLLGWAAWVAGPLVVLVLCLVAAFHLLHALLALLPDSVAARDKVVVVTGCDSGFGRALAEALARDGCVVVAACLTARATDDLNKLFRSSPTASTADADGGAARPQSIAQQCDVTSDADVGRLRETAEARLAAVPGGRGVLSVVNNAGISAGTLCEVTPVSDFEAVMQVNYLGVVRTTTALLPKVLATRGRVVTVSSVAAFIAGPGMAAYCAAKHAASAYTNVLRRELSGFGVQVINVQPGLHATAIMASVGAITAEQLDKAGATQETRARLDDAFRARMHRNVAGVKKRAADPAAVVAVLRAAVLSRRPWPVHRVGWDATCVFLPLTTCLPYFVLDLAMRARLFGRPW